MAAGPGSGERNTDLTDKMQKETAEAAEKGRHSKLRMVILTAALVLTGGVSLFLLQSALKERVRFRGERWYEQESVRESALVAERLSGPESFAFGGGTGGSSVAENWVYGNEMQIYSAGGLLAMDEEYYYVANALDGFRLYRISRDGFYYGERLSDIPAGMISVKDDRIYFVSGFANASNAPGIYSIKTDGTQQEYLSDAVPECMMLVNDWLYYLSGNDRRIYKMNTEDRREIRLTDQACVSMTIHENTIYFSALANRGNEDFGHVLAAVDVDGGSYLELARGGYFYHVMYAEGEIYYVSYKDEHFGVISPDGTGRRVAGTAELESGLQIDDGRFYFIEKSRGSAVAVYDASAGSTRYYDRENVKSFFIFDRKLYINYLEGTEEKISVHKLEDGKRIPFFE